VGGGGDFELVRKSSWAVRNSSSTGDLRTASQSAGGCGGSASSHSLGCAMAGRTISGISGVLGEIISPAPTSTESPSHKQSSAGSRKPQLAGTPVPTAPRRRRARLGRPPSKTTRHQGTKEKVTLRIPCDLIAEYRDWSWEARCQLSELVERALANYRESRPR
jgi:uncharacterized protein (DUF4415 family)